MTYTYLSRVSIFMLLIFFSSMNYTFGQVWENQHPFEQSNRLIDIEINEDGIGYTVGKSGTIFRTEDFGANWEKQITPNDSDIWVVKMIDDQNAITGGDGNILRTINGGQTWEKVDAGLGSSDTRDIIILSNGDIILSGDNVGVVKSTDGGATWVQKDVPTNKEWWHFARGTDDILFMSSEDGDIYRSDDGGDNWFATNTTTLGKVLTLDFIDENTGYANYDRNIYKTVDGGYTWEVLGEINSSFFIDDFFVVDKTTLYANLGSRLYYSIDGGLTWEEISTLTYGRYDALDVNSDGKIWASGEYNTVAFAEGVNEVWEDQFPANKNVLNFVTMQNADVGFAGGYESLLKTEDGGENWERIELITESHSDLTLGNNGEIYAACGDDGIYKSTDNANTWSSVLSNFGNYREIHVTTSGDLYTIKNNYSNGAKFYRSFDGGQTWTISDIPAILNYPNMFFLSESFGYIADFNGVLLKTQDGGETWEALDVGSDEDFSDLYFFDELNGFILGNGDLYKTEDGGQTWSISDILPQSRQIIFLDEQVGWYSGHNYFSGYIAETRDGGNTWDIQWEIDGWYRDFSLANDGSEKLWAVGRGGLITHFDGSIVDNVKNIEIEKLNIYPNPNNGNFKIDFDDDDLSEKWVQIFDNSGRIIFENIYSNQSDLNIELDDTLPSGMYWIKANSNNKNYLGKIFKE